MTCFSISPALLERYHKILDGVFDFFSGSIFGGVVLSVILLVLVFSFINNTSKR